MDIVLILLLLVLGIFCYVVFRYRKNTLEEQSDTGTSVSMSPVPQYDMAVLKENYYRLRNQIAIPSDCMKADVETTVFGLPCKTNMSGQYFLYGFYCWVAEDTLYIFPTEDHLKENYITYSTLLYEKEGVVLNSNDIPFYQIKKSEIVYYKVVGEYKSLTQVNSNDVGQYERDAIIGRIIAESTCTFIDTVDEKGKSYTRTVRKDERRVELSYHDTQSRCIVLGFGTYLLLKKNFPDKEYDLVVQKNPGLRKDSQEGTMQGENHKVSLKK